MTIKDEIELVKLTRVVLPQNKIFVGSLMHDDLAEGVEVAED